MRIGPTLERTRYRVEAVKRARKPGDCASDARGRRGHGRCVNNAGEPTAFSLSPGRPNGVGSPLSRTMTEARQLKASTILPVDRRENPAPEGSEIYKLLIDTVQDYAIFVLDPEGRVLTWNPGAQALKGVHAGRNRRPAFFQVLPVEEAVSEWLACSANFRLAEKEGRFADEGWRVRKDGTCFLGFRRHYGSTDQRWSSWAGFAKVTKRSQRAKSSRRKVVQQLKLRTRQHLIPQ